MSAQSDVALSLPSSNFESHKFKQINEQTLRIQPSIGSLLFSLVIFLIGAVLISVWAASAFSSLKGSNSIFLLLAGIAFAALGLGSYRSSNEQLIVNRETGAIFIRSWWPSVPLNTKSMFRHILPQDVNAIQLVSKVVTKTTTNRSRSGHQSGRKTTKSYTEFQVNLCTSDDERHNAIVTLKFEKAEKVGVLLAQILKAQLVNHVTPVPKQEK